LSKGAVLNVTLINIGAFNNSAFRGGFAYLSDSNTSINIVPKS
jgi:hypothetical protein